MTEWQIYISIIFAAVFANNFILVQFLGICPFLGVSKRVETSMGMGFAVIFVMSIASIFTYVVNKYILVKFDIEYLQTIAFIFIIASLVQIVEIFIKKFSRALYSALGVYLPLITTNCAVLGVALLNLTSESVNNLGHAFINGMFSGVGFLVAVVLMAGVRERMERSRIPKAFKGFPATLVIASILSMAFVGFSGVSFFQ